MKKKLALAALLGLVAFSSPARAATSFEPGVRWRTLESAHFRVDYPEGLDDIGRRVVGYAEDAHRKVAAYMKVQPYEKTEIICFDTYDDTNANASDYPHNRIMLNLHAPTPDSGIVIGRYDDWIRYVLLHEYTHILHKSETPWAISELNSILGQIFFTTVDLRGIPSYVAEYIPSFISESPRFITEGWAVTTESKFTPGGRAKEGVFDMDLREATRAGKRYTIDQVNGSYLLDWPSGGNEYDYGTYFFQYVTHTYGDDVPNRILSVLGHAPWLGIDYAVSRVLPGKTCNTLWDETMAWLDKRYQTQVAEIQRSPLTASIALTTSGRHHHHPCWLPDGTLSVTESYKDKPSALIKLAPQAGATPTRILGKDSLSDYSVTSDGRYIFYSADNGDDSRFTSYTDLFRFDTRTHHVKRLTKGLRAVEPAVSPDGKQVVAVANAKASNYLVLLDPDGKLLKQLNQPTPESTYGNPSWAPDGKTFVVARWHQGRYNIVSVDPASGLESELTAGNALDFYPSYTPDGQYMVFTSDRSGVFDLYALRMRDRRLYRLTNVLGGAFQGRVSPDGKQLAFINYTASGYDLRLTAFDPTRFQPVDSERVLASDYDGHFVPRERETPTPVDMTYALAVTPRAYSPWPTLMPHVYTPYVNNTPLGASAGFILQGQDILRQHTYYLQAASGLTGPTQGHPLLAMYYQNDQLLPSLAVTLLQAPGASFYSLPTSNGGTGLAYLWQDKQQIQLDARIPGIPQPLLGSDWVTGDSWDFGFLGSRATSYGLGSLDLARFVALDPATAASLPSSELAPDNGISNSVYAMYQRATTLRRAYGFGPESGSLSTIGYQKSSPALGSGSSFDRVWADYRRYFSLPWAHHVFAARAQTGMSWGQNGGYFFLGGNDAPTFLDQLDLTATQYSTIFNNAIGLRGYNSAGIGDKVAELSGEYRFPLFETNKGLWTLPFYVDRLYGVAGLDVANVWDSPLASDRAINWAQTMVGSSLELRGQLHLFRFVETDLRMGIAQGLSKPDGVSLPSPQLILGFGSTF